MKHNHDASVDVNLDVTLPTQELEGLVNTITDSALKIIAAFTVAQIVKAHLSR